MSRVRGPHVSNARRLPRRQVLTRQSPKMTEVLDGRHLRSLTRAQREQLIALVEVDGYDIDNQVFRARVRAVIADNERARAERGQLEEKQP